MNNNTMASNVSNVICEALGCNAKATAKLAVPVGTKGTIFLFLCDNCKLKFYSPCQDDNKSNLEVTSN
jgi:hypothetical protein